MEKVKGHFDSPVVSILSVGFLFLLLALPIAMIVIGALYLKQCPVQPYIPIYLIVGGVFSIYNQLVGMINRIHRLVSGAPPAEEQTPASSPLANLVSVVSMLMCCFIFAWFIAGNVWVYSLHVSGDFNTEDPHSSNYCNPTLYWFAFWAVTSTYIIIGAVLVYWCCCLCSPICATGMKKLCAEI